MIDPRDVIAYSRFFMFGPWCRGESTLTMASADVWRSIPSPLDAGSTVADHQTSQGKTRDLPAYACRIYVMTFRASTGLW
ncbi:hypothetical protein [Halomonas llamarensis]|uniref:Uncharacterized protein n=1 Tax=Halomonas llamarensis TaxID=2945104 RepID=A0ABT0SL70_9GAMM|nr:hypothetical protein [Halomonas llamarensis]MCL7928547.1 hypothetical protein [Halomonas llamarensis]